MTPTIRTELSFCNKRDILLFTSLNINIYKVPPVINETTFNVHKPLCQFPITGI